MKDVDKMLQEMEQVKEEVSVALLALSDATDDKTVTGLIVELNETLNNVSIANAVSALSFLLGMVLSHDKVLTNHDKIVTLGAFCVSTKAAIQTIEDDD